MQGLGRQDIATLLLEEAQGFFGCLFGLQWQAADLVCLGQAQQTQGLTQGGFFGTLCCISTHLGPFEFHGLIDWKRGGPRT